MLADSDLTAIDLLILHVLHDLQTQSNSAFLSLTGVFCMMGTGSNQQQKHAQEWRFFAVIDAKLSMFKKKKQPGPGVRRFVCTDALRPKQERPKGLLCILVPSHVGCKPWMLNCW